MRVGVDQARREDRVGLVNVVRRGILRVDFRARSDVDNAIAQNRDGAVFDHAALRVLGDDVAGAPDEVDGDRCCDGSATQ